MTSTLPDTRLNALQFYREVLLSAKNQAEREEIERTLALNDLYYLLAFVFDRDDFKFGIMLNSNQPDAKKADWLFARCREVQAQPNGMLDIWARDHYKSTIITFGLTIQNVLNNPRHNVGIFSFNVGIANDFLEQIKNELTHNETLQRLFGDRPTVPVNHRVLWEDTREATHWTVTDGLYLRVPDGRFNPKEPTISAWGLFEGQPTSKHFTIKIYDDAVTEEAVSNPEKMAKVRRYWRQSTNVGTEHEIVRYVGTFYAARDLYYDILASGEAMLRRKPCTVDGTPTGEPVFRSREFIAKRRRAQGKFVFACQMLCNPKMGGKQGFDKAWLRYWSNQDRRGLNLYLLVDPASENKKTSDYTAMWVVGLGADMNYYVLDGVKDRMGLKEKWKWLKHFQTTYRTIKQRTLIVGYEKYGMQADIEYLQEQQNRFNFRFPIIALGGQIKKNDRIKTLMPQFEGGRWYFPNQILYTNAEGEVIDLVADFINNEYDPWPLGLHDDAFDALARINDPDFPAVFPDPDTDTFGMTSPSGGFFQPEAEYEEAIGSYNPYEGL